MAYSWPPVFSYGSLSPICMSSFLSAPFLSLSPQMLRIQDVPLCHSATSYFSFFLELRRGPPCLFLLCPGQVSCPPSLPAQAVKCLVMPHCKLQAQHGSLPCLPRTYYDYGAPWAHTVPDICWSPKVLPWFVSLG